MIIDIYTHISPPKFSEELQKKSTGQIRQIPALYNPDIRLQMIEEFPDMRQVLTMPQALERMTKAEDALYLAKIANEELAEIVQRYPDKFAGVAMLPFKDMDSTLAEMDRAITDLRLRGIQINTDVNGKPLDSPEFIPIFEKMAEYDLPIFLHPKSLPGAQDYPGEKESKYNLACVLGWPEATSMAMVRLAAAGIFEKYPNLKIVTHHCGGTVPYLASRIEHSPYFESLTRPITNSLAEFYNDTAVQGNTANLTCGHAFFGSDHLVFGTDFPLVNPLLVEETINSVNAMPIPEAEKSKIFSENAKRLLKLNW